MGPEGCFSSPYFQPSEVRFLIVLSSFRSLVNQQQEEEEEEEQTHISLSVGINLIKSGRDVLLLIGLLSSRLRT